MRIEVAGRIRYRTQPGSAERDPSFETRLLCFELLSAGTSRIDRIEKLREYQATPSIRRYVLLEQDSTAVTVFSRLGSDWIAHALTEGDVLQMPEIDIEIPLAEIYADVPMAAPKSDSGEEASWS